MVDIPLHQDFEVAEPLLPGLRHRLAVGPMIVSDPVAGDDYARPVCAAAAVHKDRAKCGIVEYCQNLIYLAIRRREEPGHANPDIPHPGRFHCLSFPALVIQSASQIEHRANSAAGKGGNVLPGWLQPAKDVIVNTVEPRSSLLRTDRRGQEQHQAQTIQAI